MGSCEECHCDSAVAISLECGDKCSTKLVGTVLENKQPVLIQVDQLRFSSPVVLADKLLVFKTTSNPSNVFGQIAQFSSAEKINIIAFHSACNTSHGVGIVKLGCDIKSDSKILSLDGVVQVAF